MSIFEIDHLWDELLEPLEPLEYAALPTNKLRDLTRRSNESVLLKRKIALFENASLFRRIIMAIKGEL